MAHVVAQRRRERQHERARRVDARVLVRQVGDPMEGHRRLARPRAPAHDETSGTGAADQLELIGIEQPRDVGKSLVGALREASRLGAEPAPASLRQAVGAQGRPLAPGEARRPRLDAAPDPIRTDPGPASLGRVDSFESAGSNRDRATRRDLAGHQPSRQLLLVGLALLVAVEEAGDRRVAPVDDAHAAADAGGSTEEDVALPARLAEPQVREVGRARLHAGRGARGAELAQERASPVPLLEQGQLILLLLARDQEAPDALQLLHERSLGGPVLGHLVGQHAQRLIEQVQLLGDDRMRRVAQVGSRRSRGLGM